MSSHDPSRPRLGNAALLGLTLGALVGALACWAWILFSPQPPCPSEDPEGCLAAITGRQQLVEFLTLVGFALGLGGGGLALLLLDRYRGRKT